MGPSLHDENSYCVIHRFDSLARRAEGEDAYYVSDAWRLVPRAAILALIENRFARILSLRWLRSQCRDCESKIMLTFRPSLNFVPSRQADSSASQWRVEEWLHP